MGQVARLVCAFPGTIVVLAVLLSVASIWVVCTRFNIVNNTSDLISDKSPYKQDFNELTKDFGPDDRFIVLIKSPDIAKNRQAADAIGQYLETLHPQVSTVLYKIDYSAVKPRLLFTRDVSQLRQIADQLNSEVSMQKSNAQQSQKIAMDLNSILDEANQKFDDKYLRDKKNWGDFNVFVKRFVSVLNKIADQASGKNAVAAPLSSSSIDEEDDDIDANEMIAQHEYFSLRDGQAVLVFGYAGEEEKNSAGPYTQTVQKIRDYLKDLSSKPEYQGVEMSLTGEPVLDDDQNTASTSDTIHALCITIALIITLFFFSYRTFLRPTFAFTVLIMAVLWSLGFALVGVGHFNVLSIAVIPMVLGIGIDFGIQILGRYEEELGRHSDVRRAIMASLQHTGVAIITGGSTTAVAFFTLCFNDFVGLAELGIIAGASMVLCIAANLVVLPAVFLLRDRNRTPQQLQAQSSNSAWTFIHSWDKDMVRTPWLWLGLSALISVVAAFSLPHLKFDYNLLHLQNQNTPSVKVLYEVMDASKNTDGKQVSTIYASVVTDNIDEARALREKLLKLPVVARVDSPLDLFPEDQDTKLPIVREIVAAAAALNVQASPDSSIDIPRARRDIASLLQKAQDGLKEATAWQGVNKVAKQAVAAFSTMIPALERAKNALNSASVEVVTKRFSAGSNGAFTRMQKNMELLKTQKGDRGMTQADIPPQLQKLFIAPNGKILLQVYGKKDLWERDADVEFTNQVLSVAPHATGTPILNAYATELLRVSYLWAAVWAFVAIVILILLHFQSFKFLLLTLFPLALAVLWRTGAMVWFNIEFNPANIVTLPLIIGIDVAFGVYIIDRYREDGCFKIFSESTGKAIIMSSLTSMFGFGSLLVSQFTGMFSIGLLMSLGIAIGLVTAIFILPQVLALLKPRTPEATHDETSADRPN